MSLECNFGEGLIKGGEIAYFEKDHLGSVRAVVNQNGETVGTNDYYPFGMRHNGGLLYANNRYQFNGKEQQTTGGLNFLDYGARMYDSELGRWFVKDPLADKYYSLSPYNYCANNPMKFVDPDGKKIRLAPGSSAEFQQKFAQTVQYMNERGTSGLMASLDASKEVYYVKEAKDSRFTTIDKTINWNPDLIMRTDNLIYLSPATVLNHELDHANQFDKNPRQQRLDKVNLVEGYEDNEEKRVITGSEQETAKKHGEIKEGEVTRTDHNAEVDSNVSNKTPWEIEEYIKQQKEMINGN